MSEVAKVYKHREETGCVRMSFNLPVEVYEELSTTFQWGQRGRFIAAVVELALNKVRTGGYATIGAIIVGDYDPLLSTPTQKEEDDEST